MRFHVFALLLMVVFIAAPRPHSFTQKDPAHAGPGNFATLMDPAEGCIYEYCNSMELTTTACSGEFGDPPAAGAIKWGATDPDCDFTGAGVTHGAQALNVGAAQSLELTGAYDASGQSNVYFKFDALVTESSLNNTYNEIFSPYDAVPGTKYPTVLINDHAATHSFGMRCAAGVTSTPIVYTEDEQYTIFLDANTASSTEQRFWVYDSEGRLTGTETCDTTALNTGMVGASLGMWGGGATSDVVIDNFAVNFSPMPMPPLAYANSFEVTPTTNCATDVGEPAATIDVTGTDIVCDETTDGVTDGAQSMDLSAIAGSPESQFIHIRDLDTTGHDTVYVQFSLRHNGGDLNNTARNAFIPTDGAASPTDLYPMFEVYYGGVWKGFYLTCSGSNWDSGFTVPSFPKQYTVQLDIRSANGATQNVRAYEAGNDTPVYQDSCASEQVNLLKGIKLGKMGGNQLDMQIDNLIVSDSPIAAPTS